MLLGVLLASAQEFAIHTLPTQQQLPVASIHSIMQDREGYLWYATSGGGLCRDNGYQLTVFRPTDTKMPQEACKVNCLAEDAQGNILFGTADGLFMIDKRDYSVRRIVLGNTHPYVEALMADSQGYIWIGMHGTIYRRDG